MEEIGELAWNKMGIAHKSLIHPASKQASKQLSTKHASLQDGLQELVELEYVGYMKK